MKNEISCMEHGCPKKFKRHNLEELRVPNEVRLLFLKYNTEFAIA